LKSQTTITAQPAPALSLGLSPCDVAARLAHLPGLVFFDSALENEPHEQQSIVAAAPSEIIAGSTPDDWQKLQREIARRTETDGAHEELSGGIAAGFVDYDGAFCFGFYDDILVYRHADHSWHGSKKLTAQIAGQSANATAQKPVFESKISREDFCRMVRRAKEYIAAGDIYQVNISQQFSAPWNGNAMVFYEKLRRFSPAPYAAFLELGGRTILSASPESFLRMSGREIRTRPIKGTRPRRADSGDDARSASDLISSPKEIAELVMITDLERNDLGQVCEYGSVRVKELLALERYEQVFHLVSTVEGILRAGIDHLAALQSCFPGGSITGAPKKRAREIIAEIEPVARGLYTGALGWFGCKGESRFNIAIRTVVIENFTAHFHVGAGIVADSIPEMEYEETLHKAAGILLAAERV
jgi:aminodeoxychorismate synthase component I